jgi:hypothetical protein
MWSTLPTLFALLLGYGLMPIGNTLQATLLTVRGGLEGFSPAQIGAVGAGFWGGIVIASIYGEAVISRVGLIRTFAALAAIASAAALLHLLIIDPLVWIPPRTDRVPLRRSVHGRRKLAERCRNGSDARPDPEPLWHDWIDGRNRRATASAVE